jgi:hypothetical protein
VIRVVIVGGDYPRNKNLYKDLQDSGLFQVEIQPRVNKSDLLGVLDSERGSVKEYGRTLSISERCCALAHSLAQESLASTGGVILEDDAVILDIQSLADFASQVVDSKRSILLNYSTVKCAEDVNWNTTNNSIIRIIGPSSLAVGYAASRSKLSQMLQANHNLEYVADWPQTTGGNLRLKYPIVAHGHRNNASLIENTSNRNQSSLCELVIQAHFKAVLVRIRQKFQFELTNVILWLRRAEK